MLVAVGLLGGIVFSVIVTEVVIGLIYPGWGALYLQHPDLTVLEVISTFALFAIVIVSRVAAYWINSWKKGRLGSLGAILTFAAFALQLTVEVRWI